MSSPVFAVTGSRLLTTERHADAVAEGLIWVGKLLGRGALMLNGGSPAAWRTNEHGVKALCTGADELARDRWVRWGQPVREFPARWGELGHRAGLVRNEEMASYPELGLCMAWPHPDPSVRSAGTWHMVGECLARSITVLSGWDLQPILSVPELPPARAYSGPMPHQGALT